MAFGDVVQTKTASGEDSASLVFDSAPTEGNLVVVGVRISTSGGQGATTPTGYQAGPTESATRGGIAMFGKVAGASESATVNCAATGTATVIAVGVEYEGPFASPPWDGSNTGTSGNTQVSTLNTGSTGTLGDDQALVVAVAGQILTLNDISSWSDSFFDVAGLEFDGTNDGTIGMASKVVSATTAQSTTATFAGSGRSKAAIWAFLAGAGAGTYTGSGTPALDDVTSAGSGTMSPPGFVTGSGTPALDSVVAAGAGTFTAPTYPGDIPAAAIIAMYDARTLAGSEGDPVASWADSGPIPQDPLAQASSSLRPFITDLGFGGVRSVESDGDDDYLAVVFDQTYSGDYALIYVKECITYPAKVASAGVVFSTGSVPNKVLDGFDGQAPEGHVFMVTGGAAEDHTTITLDQTYMEDTPSRYVMGQYLDDTNQTHKVWENGAVLFETDEGEALNNMPGLTMFIREDLSRPGHVRVGFWMAVKMDGVDAATESELIAAMAELRTAFNVTGFFDNEGTGTPALEDVTASGAGTFVAPVYTGSGTPSLEDVTADGAGDADAPIYVGTGTPALEAFVSAGAGTLDAPGFTGSGAITLEDYESAGVGNHNDPGTVEGSGSPEIDDVTADGSGTFTAPIYDGNGPATLEHFTSAGTGSFNPLSIHNGDGEPELEDAVAAGVGSFTVGPFSATGNGAAVLEPAFAGGVGSFFVPAPLPDGSPTVRPARRPPHVRGVIRPPGVKP